MSSNGVHVTDEAGLPPGTIDSDLLAPRDREIAERKAKAIASRTTPKGLLGLPKLLDDRRLEYGITDAAFKRHATFDRVFVWQIPMQAGDTFEDGGLIHMAGTTKDRERATAPHGIIISAGLKALDELVSNGMDLGHRVLFCHSAPYFVRYDTVLGQHQHLVILRAGDIIGSEDLATNLKARKVRIMQNRDEALRVEHVLVDENGRAVLPMAAEGDED
jgi:hypothetical protein